jgi:uracil-DNA glycosylase
MQDYLKEEAKLPYFKRLEKKVIDDPLNIVSSPFEVFKLLTLESIKMVIVGQDPYASGIKENGVYVPYFDGISFSSKNTKKAPQSLQVLKRLFLNTDLLLGNDIGAMPNDLRYLVERGVFLANTAWTVSQNRPLSHMWDEWIIFSSRLMQYISTKKKVPFLFLGSKAAGLANHVHRQCPVFFEQHPAAEKYKSNTKKTEDSKVLYEISKITGIKWTL